MKNDEIKKALKNYIVYYGKDILVADNVKVEDILSLINRYESEIERLKAQIAVYEGWVINNE